ncbi:MAG: thiopurine S-methyltransferase [Planctomycetota bacterium]
MEAEFWHERWKDNNIGFHEGKPNSLLVKHLGQLGLKKGARVFVPLCGKTCDLGWFMEQGFEVVGVELSKTAVEQLFEELGLRPRLKSDGPLVRYSAEGIEILQGNLFEVSSELIGTVDAHYDRAALVALPPTLRDNYALHVAKITDSAPQLLICFDYEQKVMDGPPFSVDEAEVRRLYGTSYDLNLLERAEVAGGLKGKCPAAEDVWILRQK